ncbi:hypothetical protein [Paenibacillus popilliae]|uniref:hypothetical protein n=1 Tax=Paenibacillus popilliae TaxID=78057 RepID=UPI0002E938EF|nr:hypothetical protein [Paenibacillus popilliae]
MSMTQIADELGRDRKTIRKWLQADEPGVYLKRKPTAGKLDAYKEVYTPSYGGRLSECESHSGRDPGERLHRQQHHPSNLHAAAATVHSIESDGAVRDGAWRTSAGGLGTFQG